MANGWSEHLPEYIALAKAELEVGFVPCEGEPSCPACIEAGMCLDPALPAHGLEPLHAFVPHERDGLRLHVGHVLDVLAEMPADSVDCIVTSPPYWSLRRYEGPTDTIWGGDPACCHEWADDIRSGEVRLNEKLTGGTEKASFSPRQVNPDAFVSVRYVFGFCALCSAWRGQLGLEPTVEAFIAHLMQVMAALRRVLKPTGVCWINLGDSYAASPGQRKATDAHGEKQDTNSGANALGSRSDPSLKPKNLCLVPERFVLAAQAQGWWVRSRIAWTKPNPMPESARDRPTDSWEHIFMLTKSGSPQFWTNASTGEISTVEPRTLGRWEEDVDWRWHERKDKRVQRSIWEGHDYWWDGDAVREILSAPDRSGTNPIHSELTTLNGRDRGRSPVAIESNPAGRNLRNVWAFPTAPMPLAHFATFPPALPEKCILASCPEWVCSACQKPRVRLVAEKRPKDYAGKEIRHGTDYAAMRMPDKWDTLVTTTGWTDCGHDSFEGGVVLDPFAGSGTTLAVARKLRRQGWGIEISPEYAEMARQRLEYGVSGAVAIAGGQPPLVAL